MKDQIQALKAELIKIKRAKIVLVAFIAFALAPIMGGVFMIILSDPYLSEQAGALSAKAELLSMEVNWESFLRMLSQTVGVGGIMVFGFTASWLFGREYSDGTVNDLLSLPVSRIKILNAKFIVYVFWGLLLAVSNLCIGFIIGFALNLPDLEAHVLYSTISIYGLTTILTLCVGTPVAFLAIFGKGYLAPLAFMTLLLVLSQIMAAMGIGYYFPWSVPALLSGAAGEFKTQLNTLSYLILMGTSFIGYGSTIFYWKYADQN